MLEAHMNSGAIEVVNSDLHIEGSHFLNNEAVLSAGAIHLVCDLK